MLLKIIFLFVTFSSSSLALECQTPFVKALPASRFSATSNALKAPDVRFTTVPHWCPATADGENEYVTIDLQCARSVCQVEGKDENDNLLFYSGEYSKDGSTWKPLESDVETHYDSILKAFEANNKAVITPAISARFFRFRLPFWAGGAKPCIKVELYGEADSVESLGCFKERPKGPKSKKAMPVVYHSIKGVNPKSPDISAIYEECRQKADEYKKFQIEVFGIYNNGKCVTTASGKEDQYSRYGKSTKCSVCGEKGIGTKKGSTFVYKRQL